MNFEKIKANWKKYTATFFKVVIGFYFASFFGKIFDPLNDFLVGALKGHALLIYSGTVTFLNSPIPLYSLLLALIFVFFINKFLNWVKIKKSELKIIEAKYGKNEKYIDITNELNRLVEGNKLKVVINNGIAGDPLVGVNKEAVIKYRNDGIEKDIVVPEYQVLELP